MIVRWTLSELPAVLADLGIERPLLVTSKRWRDLELPAEAVDDGVRPHVPSETVEAAAERAIRRRAHPGPSA